MGPVAPMGGATPPASMTNPPVSPTSPEGSAPSPGGPDPSAGPRPGLLEESFGNPPVFREGMNPFIPVLADGDTDDVPPEVIDEVMNSDDPAKAYEDAWRRLQGPKYGYPSGKEA